MAKGPAVPFQADLTSPRLEIDIVIGGDPATGGFRAVEVVGDFTAGISLRTSFGGVDLAAIEQWILTDVNENLNIRSTSSTWAPRSPARSTRCAAY